MAQCAKDHSRLTDEVFLLLSYFALQREGKPHPSRANRLELLSPAWFRAAHLPLRGEGYFMRIRQAPNISGTLNRLASAFSSQGKAALIQIFKFMRGSCPFLRLLFSFSAALVFSRFL